MVTVANRMALIEGVGDEVVLFLALILILGCIMLAWFSTSVAEQPLIRTAVLVIERRRTSSRLNESTQESTGTDITATEPTVTGQIDKTDNSFQPSTSTDSESPDDADISVAGACDGHAGPSRKPETCDEEEISSVQCNQNINDALGEEISSDRRHLRKRVTESSKNKDQEASDAAQKSAPVIESEDGTIRIRLKFLNDTQRMVEGKLEEPLGEFKRRYFESELENDKIVRLIFNGQLLRSDQETLQFYGLFDNCVVHCQISNNIAPPPAGQSEAYNEMDLSRFMLPLFGVILGAIWYCRIQYRQFFNATSTFALLGITGLFFVSLIAIFIPRREYRPPSWTVEESLRR